MERGRRGDRRRRRRLAIIRLFLRLFVSLSPGLLVTLSRMFRVAALPLGRLADSFFLAFSHLRPVDNSFLLPRWLFRFFTLSLHDSAASKGDIHRIASFQVRGQIPGQDDMSTVNQ